MWVQFDSWMPVVRATVGVSFRLGFVEWEPTNNGSAVQQISSDFVHSSRPITSVDLLEPVLKWRSVPLIQQVSHWEHRSIWDDYFSEPQPGWGSNQRQPRWAYLFTLGGG